MAKKCTKCKHDNEISAFAYCLRCRVMARGWNKKHRKVRVKANKCARCNNLAEARLKHCQPCLDAMKEYRDSCTERLGINFYEYGKRLRLLKEEYRDSCPERLGMT